MFIDLHGIEINEASAKIYNALFSFFNDKFLDKLTIMTGKGTGALINLTIEILNQENIIYTYISKTNSFIIKKDNNLENNDFFVDISNDWRD